VVELAITVPRAAHLEARKMQPTLEVSRAGDALAVLELRLEDEVGVGRGRFGVSVSEGAGVRRLADPRLLVTLVERRVAGSIDTGLRYAGLGEGRPTNHRLLPHVAVASRSHLGREGLRGVVRGRTAPGGECEEEKCGLDRRSAALENDGSVHDGSWVLGAATIARPRGLERRRKDGPAVCGSAR